MVENKIEHNHHRSSADRCGQEETLMYKNRSSGIIYNGPNKKKKHNEEKRREEAVERKTKIIKSKDTASIKKLRERDERKQVHRPKTTTEAALAVGLFARST